MINLAFGSASPVNLSKWNLEEKISLILCQLLVPPDTDITIVIENDEFLQNLNHSYRNIDFPTDVLSFSSDTVDPETGNRYLGDIIISIDRVYEQAAVHAVTPQCELLLLITHGILHLLDHDHDTPQGQQEMWLIQRNILDTFNCTFNGEL